MTTLRFGSAIDATLDPVVGGTARWTHANGDTCSGRYLELVPDRRIVFTYGWERTELPDTGGFAAQPRPVRSYAAGRPPSRAGSQVRASPR